MPLEEFRSIALASAAGPEGRDAERRTGEDESSSLPIANGSTDPTFSAWWTHNPSFNNPFANNTIGASVSIPLRIFDRNQGEKARTQIDIGRNERLRDAAQAQVFSDVDSAYWTSGAGAESACGRIKRNICQLAEDIRDRIAFSYQNGGAVAARLPGRGEGVSGHPLGVLESDWFLFDRGGPDEHGSGPGGDAMNRVNSS